jgi:hypothetical protein
MTSIAISRSPILSGAVPAMNRLNGLRGLCHWPLHGNFNAGIEDLGPLAVVVVGTTTPRADAWTANPGFYTFNNDNGSTVNNTVPLNILDADYDAGDSEAQYLDPILSLVGMNTGTQIIHTCELILPTAQLTDNGTIWAYGRGSQPSLLGLHIVQSSSAPAIIWRGRNASASQAQTLTYVSGPALSTYYGAGRFACVHEIVALDTQYCDTRVVLQRSGQSPSIYEYASCDMLASAATAPPGLGTQTAANHGGYTLGARLGASAGTYTNCLGRGINGAAIGNAFAQKWLTADTNRALAAASSQVAGPAWPPAIFKN